MIENLKKSPSFIGPLVNKIKTCSNKEISKKYISIYKNDLKEKVDNTNSIESKL